MHFTTKIPPDMAGRRLDQALVELFPDYSRARLQQWLKQGEILVDGAQWKAKAKVKGGETVELNAIEEAVNDWQAQDIPLNIVYEDDSLIVVDKPVGLVVHPGAGNPDNTLVNALLNHDSRLESLPRAGIIHRIDKDTSGLLVVARTLQAHAFLVAELEARQFERHYHAIVNGNIIAGGEVDAPIGRHPTHRIRMAVVGNGKPAITHYRVLARYRAHTHIQAKLETGRTHQIRVHMAHIHHPLVGDPLYGGRVHLPPAAAEDLRTLLQTFPRQALHAASLGLTHPVSGEFVEWQSPIPADMQMLMDALEEDVRQLDES